MTQPTYTAAQLQALMDNWAKGVVKFRDGDQWVEFDSLLAMKRNIDIIKLELFPDSDTKPKGATLIRVGKAY